MQKDFKQSSLTNYFSRISTNAMLKQKLKNAEAENAMLIYRIASLENRIELRKLEENDEMLVDEEIQIEEEPQEQEKRHKYDIKFKLRVVKEYEDNGNAYGTAKSFGIHKASVLDW